MKLHTLIEMLLLWLLASVDFTLITIGAVLAAGRDLAVAGDWCALERAPLGEHYDFISKARIEITKIVFEQKKRESKTSTHLRCKLL